MKTPCTPCTCLWSYGVHHRMFVSERALVRLRRYIARRSQNIVDNDDLYKLERAVYIYRQRTNERWCAITRPMTALEPLKPETRSAPVRTPIVKATLDDLA